jgi:hypothetical protein
MKVIIRKTCLLSQPEQTACSGEFSVIQFCPDAGRDEAVNVGVFLYCPKKDFIATRMRPDNERVRRLFGEGVILEDHLEAIKHNIEYRLERNKAEFKTSGHVSYFIGNLANDIRMTELRSVRVENPQETLDRLYNDLVAEPKPRR